MRKILLLLGVALLITGIAVSGGSNTYTTTTHKSTLTSHKGKTTVRHYAIDWEITPDTCIMYVEGMEPTFEHRKNISYDADNGTVTFTLAGAYTITYE